MTPSASVNRDTPAPAGFRIRPAVAADVRQVAAFTRKTFAWGDYVEESFAGWLAEDDSALVVAEAEGSGQVVGIVHAVLCAPAQAWLEGLRVHPQFRRMGIADALNSAGRAWATTVGADKVRLAVDAENWAARRQVERLGFLPAATFLHAEATAAIATATTTPTGTGPGAAPSDTTAAALHVRLALAGDAAAVRRAWSQSLAVLWARGWRWWSADWTDVNLALRFQKILIGGGGIVVCDLTGRPAEVRCLAFSQDDERRGLATCVGLLSGVVAAARATGCATVRALVPADGALQAGLKATGFEVRSTIVVYEAPPDTTW